MKLDLSLVRNILEDCESVPAGTPIERFEFEGVPDAVVTEHVVLLIEEGFLEGVTAYNERGVAFQYHIFRMKMPGHNFVRNARNDTVWKKLIEQAKDKGGSLPLNLASTVLEKAAVKYLGLDE